MGEVHLPLVYDAEACLNKGFKHASERMQPHRFSTMVRARELRTLVVVRGAIIR